MEFPLVVSYYTRDTLYQLEVQNLIASCVQFGIAHHIEGIDNAGSWECNCAYKPYFLLKMLREHRRGILWVDADAVFERVPPVLPEFAADLALRIEAQVPDTHPSKVLTGTLYCNATPEAEQLLGRWQQETARQLVDPKRTEEFWDQTALRDVLFHPDRVGKIAALPRSFVNIFDHAGDLKEVKEPVITHYQASRRYKKTLR